MAFTITALCVNCHACMDVCPNEAIVAEHPHFRIDTRKCTECEGAYADPQCASICPVEGAIFDAFGTPLNPPGSLTGIPQMTPPPGADPMLKPVEFTLDDLPAGARRLYERLRGAATGRDNDEWLARMLVSQAWGRGVMPRRLGLTAGDFAALMAHHFPGVSLVPFLHGPEPDPGRLPEFDDLRHLFLSHGEDGEDTPWIATMLAAGCMGGDHLWQDLGLWSRRDLSALIGGNFPALAARNVHDMKWKKFFYKQLCQQEGIYACRAPSCEVCSDYPTCFGPE